MVLTERPRARSPIAIENVACVAGAKREVGEEGEIEKGKRERSPLSPQSPSPFSLPPYPLPLSTPATQATRTYRCQETCYDVSVHRPYRLWG